MNAGAEHPDEAPPPAGAEHPDEAPPPAGAEHPDAKEEKSVKDITSGLIGSIYANSPPDTQQSQINEVINLRSIALGLGQEAAPAPGGAPPASATTPKLARTELEGMARAAEIPSLDNAAKILTGITALVTGLFVGIGFTTGDFVHMIRDFQGQGITFLILTSLALLLGTFAFVVNAYRSRTNLWAERLAVYIGIICAGAAFVFASWGLAQGASAGQTRPVISASFNANSANPVLNVSVSSSNVPRSEHLTTTVWGDTAQGWTVLSNLVTGPAPDGTDNANITVNNVATDTAIKVQAFLSSNDIPTVLTPPENCPANTSCFVLFGLRPSSPSPTASPLPTA